MSAIELIEQLKTLPPREQADFARLFRKMQEQVSGVPRDRGEYAPAHQWPDFALRLRRIYGERVVADSESVISYGRGER